MQRTWKRIGIGLMVAYAIVHYLAQMQRQDAACQWINTHSVMDEPEK